MSKLSKRTVDQAAVSDKDYFVWDDELRGFGPRVFKSGRRSYLMQYRARGRIRRFTIGTHRVDARYRSHQARVLVGRGSSSLRSYVERPLRQVLFNDVATGSVRSYVQSFGAVMRPLASMVSATRVADHRFALEAHD